MEYEGIHQAMHRFRRGQLQDSEDHQGHRRSVKVQRHDDPSLSTLQRLLLLLSAFQSQSAKHLHHQRTGIRRVYRGAEVHHQASHSGQNNAQIVCVSVRWRR